MPDKNNSLFDFEFKENKRKSAEIRKDLKSQLEKQGKTERYFIDLVEDYVFNVILKDSLQYDIEKNGVRYLKTTGNGFKVEQPNESVRNLNQVTNQMLKILQDLGLQEPQPSEDMNDDDFL